MTSFKPAGIYMLKIYKPAFSLRQSGCRAMIGYFFALLLLLLVGLRRANTVVGVILCIPGLNKSVLRQPKSMQDKFLSKVKIRTNFSVLVFSFAPSVNSIFLHIFYTFVGLLLTGIRLTIEVDLPLFKTDNK